MTLAKIFSSRAAQAATLFVVGLAAGLAAAAPDSVLSPAVRVVVIAGSLAAAAWIGAVYWRTLDEVAREAQKWGWYWGGTTGLVVAAILVGIFPDRVVAWAGTQLSQTDLVLLTGQLIIGVQLIGFLVGWAVWWWRRR